MGEKVAATCGAEQCEQGKKLIRSLAPIGQKEEKTGNSLSVRDGEAWG